MVDDSIDTQSTEKTTLTNWTNEPSIDDLKQNITDAEVDHDTHIAKVKTWLENLNMEGSAKITVVKGNSSVAPKVIRRQAEWRYSSLSEPFLSTPDVFNVNPVTAGDRNRAKQNALVLNNQFNTKINKVAFIDDYVRDAVDIGTVFVRVGWLSEDEEIETEEDTYEFQPTNDPEKIQQYIQLLQLKKSNRDIYEEHMNPGLDQALTIFAQTGQVTIPKVTGSEMVTKTVETKNHPTADIVDINNLIIDPSCEGDLDKASFIGERFKTSLSELEKDGKYKNLKFINVESVSPIADPDFDDSKDIENFEFTDKPKKQFIVHSWWGLWDINGDGLTVPIVAAWVENTMIRLELNPFPDQKPPFIEAVYMPVRKSLFGEPDGALIEENQKIIGAVSRGMIDLLGKSANGQTGFKKNLLDVVNKRKYRRGDDYEFMATGDPRQGIYEHKYPEIPRSAFDMITLQNADAESLTGVKAYNTGISGQALGNVATGVRSALDAASKRELGILRRLAYGVVQIGRKFISMNAEFLSEEEVIRITNTEFVTVRRDDLPGNFDLELSISTAEEDNKKAEELAFMLQTMGNNMDPELMKMILSDLARLRKMPAMAKKIEDYQPEPSEFEKIKMQLELNLLKAQIAKEETLAIKHAATAELDGVKGLREITQAKLNDAKKDTERAKSRNLSSDSDNKDLAYLEQESGVNQARMLEQIDKKDEKKEAKPA